MKKRLVIDLGTANTKFSDKSTGDVFKAPSVVAIDNKTKKVIAAGTSAKDMLGRTPLDVSVVFPIKSGAVSDFDVACAMMRVFLNDFLPKSTFRVGAELLVSRHLTDMEIRILKEAAERSGVKVVDIITTSLQENSPKGQMVVDIGAGKTECTVLSFGGIVSSACVFFGGDEMDKNIQDYLKSAYGVTIGKNTAEQIKLNVGSAHPETDTRTYTFMGRTYDTGLPVETTVTSNEIRSAIGSTLLKILNVIETVLENTPPELSRDLKENGIILSGGGAKLPGLDRFIEENIGLFAQVFDS